MTSSVPGDSFLNQRLGRYHILERIGTGGMARVYKGRDTNLDRSVAIKIMHEHLASQPSFQERFQREAKFIASLNHPHIVQVYDFDTMSAGGQMTSYMVMPFISGPTLREIIDEARRRGVKLPRTRVIAIIGDLCAALGYAHENGMVHRDVKPGNILFNEQKHAVLTDFGIARLKEAAQLTTEGATVGTPQYLSPEQASGLPVDGRSDLYAVGVILFELLTGEPPFDDSSTIALLLKHLNAPVPSVSEKLGITNPALDALIHKALAKNPDNRFQTAAAFAAEVQQVLGQNAVYQRTTDLVPASLVGDGSFKPAMLTPAPASAGSYTPAPIAPALVQATSSQTITLPQRFSVFGLVAGIIGIAALSLTVGLLIRGNSGAATSANSELSASIDGPYFLSTFNEDDSTLVGWQQSNSGSIVREITPDGFYRFENQLAGQALTAMFDTLYRYQDGTIMMEGRLTDDSQPNSGYGIVFRYQDPRNYNVFAVDGVGRYSMWRLRDSQWIELRGKDEEWTPDRFINVRGDSNQLTVVFMGDRLRGMVNGQLVVDLTSPDPVKAGAIGLYLGTPSDGGAALLVDNFQISSEIPSMVGS
jgi:serine/threonine protein kinase